jgi:hypothetical protein
VLEIVDLLEMDDGKFCPITLYKGLKIPLTPDELELIGETDEGEESCEGEEVDLDEIMSEMNTWREKNHNIFKNSEIFWDKFFEEMLNKFN